MAGVVTAVRPPRKRRTPRAPTPWWGEGPPPTERWPGVTMDFKATWSNLRDRWESDEGRFFFDTDASDRAVHFFPLYLRHHIGEWDGEPFVLRDDQAQLLIMPTFGWKRTDNGLRRFRKLFAFCPKGYGKALDIDTPIPTPSGWTTIGQLVAGDQVYDECGHACTVTAAHAVRVDRPCYRVRFDDHSSIVADADHLWRVERADAILWRRSALRTTRAIGQRIQTQALQVASPSGYRRIVSCDVVPSVPVRCISVNSTTHLYLAGPGSIPTHNSPVGAGLAIYLARCDHEPAAEVYAVAADRENAKIVHDNAKIMVEGSMDLSDGCEILRDSIFWYDTHSSLKVLSSDAATKHGFRPHGVIFDELHAQRNRDLYEALKKSMVKRRQPLMVIITHAGTDDTTICFEEYDLARRILSGSADVETTLPVIFEKKPADSWSDPAVWPRVNPGHGITVKHEGIVEECQEALAEPRKRNDFLRYHLNVWTSAATAWIPIEWWDACEAAVEETELLTLDCAAGLDLAQKWDLACFCVGFRKYLPVTQNVEVLTEDEAGAVITKTVPLNYILVVRPYFWIPEETMRQHEKEDGVPYSLWAESGLVTATEGPVIDYTRIYSDIVTKIVPKYPRLKQGVIGYDPAFASDLATKLRDLGNLRTVEVQQNYKMLSEPSQVVEALIKGRRVDHAGHRVLRWNWENATIKSDDAGRIRPVKPKNAHKRIDGAVAMIMAEKALSLQPRTPDFQVFFAGPSHERKP